MTRRPACEPAVPTMCPKPDEDDGFVGELPSLPHVMPLSDRDRDMVLAMIENPPPPNEALRKLMAGQYDPTWGEPHGID